MKKFWRILAVSFGLFLIFVLVVGLANVKRPKDPAEIYEEADYVADIRTIEEDIIFGEIQKSQLSGCLFKHKGKYYILTAGHITPDNPLFEIKEIKVFFKGQPGIYFAKIVKTGTERGIDCALLKIDDVGGEKFTFLGKLPKFGSSEQLRGGDPVYSIGSPLELPYTFGAGVVKNTGFEFPNGGNIVHSAEIAPGSSGGPLINKYGEVIGINVSMNKIFHNFCLAVPIDLIKQWLREIDADL